MAMRDPRQRFWEKVDKTSSPNGCWLWTGSINIKSGYGQFNPGGRSAPVPAHRFSYELLVGPIGADLVSDHICRVRRCVNPGHIEPVTYRENCVRGLSPLAEKASATHCIRGHEFTTDNTWIRASDGTRNCRECTRTRNREAGRRARAIWDRTRQCVRCRATFYRSRLSSAHKYCDHCGDAVRYQQRMASKRAARASRRSP